MVTLDEADGNVKLNSDVNVALDSLALYLWELSICPQWDHWEENLSGRIHLSAAHGVHLRPSKPN